MKYVDYLMEKHSCVLCNYPREFVIHDSKFFDIILARAPYIQDHMMIISKRHLDNFHELTKDEYDELGHLIEKANKLVYHLGYMDLSLFARDGIAGGTSGKSITHFHYHVLPGADVRGIGINNAERHFMSDEEFLEKSEKMKGRWENFHHST